jgi:hypothetical protein
MSKISKSDQMLADMYAGHIASARAQYCNDDIEIDDITRVSPTDDGCWVQAWVWVHDDEVGE